MTKRLLALALCLAMMTSLLPLTAAADTPVTVNSVQITASGLKKEPLPEPIGGIANVYRPEITNWSCNLATNASITDRQISSYIGTNEVITQPELITEDPVEGQTYYVHVVILLKSNTVIECSFAENFLAISSLTLPGYETELVYKDFFENEDRSDEWEIWLRFSLTKKHEHDWKFTVSKNNDTLTAECQNTDCGKKVSVSLEADSVTLPTSPFNARLEGWDAFQAATGAEKTDIVYKCNGVGVSDGSTPKAGQYQAWVMIKNLRGPVYQDGVAAFADNQDSSGNTAELLVHYTAVDPKVTAQTGDNRPIEIMMGSVVVFSALAAAAFILDSKRRSQQ